MSAPNVVDVHRFLMLDPHACCALPSPATCRGPLHLATDRIPLHPQARQLAQHGRAVRCLDAAGGGASQVVQIALLGLCITAAQRLRR